MIAGPNGAGKTTVAADVLVGALAVQEFVNADTIAEGLSAFQPESVAFDAGRIMLQRLHHLDAQRGARFSVQRRTLVRRLSAEADSDTLKRAPQMAVARVQSGSWRVAIRCRKRPSAGATKQV